MAVTMQIYIFAIVCLLSIVSGFKINDFNSKCHTKHIDSPLEKVDGSVSRRDILKTAPLVFLGGVLSGSSRSEAIFGFGPSKSQEQKNVEEIAKYRVPVEKVVKELKSKQLRGGPDDSFVVINYLKTYYDPMQVKMVEVAKTLNLEAEKQKKIETLPLLMKGHLLELQQACVAQSAKDQLEEMEEVEETLAEFLTLAQSKYNIPELVDSRSATPEEYFGAFGCEFWGLKRRKDSNYCEPADK
mmetsp:Transcript_1244/g.1656  ORF Transcript_1244/g.1656 Transcript_1244/m.1656 type:complete len:242 (-) Transcript_1244:200-925(-)